MAKQALPKATITEDKWYDELDIPHTSAVVTIPGYRHESLHDPHIYDIPATIVVIAAGPEAMAQIMQKVLGFTTNELAWDNNTPYLPSSINQYTQETQIHLIVNDTPAFFVIHAMTCIFEYLTQKQVNQLSDLVANEVY
jgi:hypothetical protein